MKLTKIQKGILWLGFPIYSFTVTMILYVMVSVIGYIIYNKPIDFNGVKFPLGIIAAVVGIFLSGLIIGTTVSYNSPPSYYICDADKCRNNATQRFKIED